MRRTKIVFAAALFCCLAFAETGKPDFSGTWKLNNGKSSQDGPADRVYVENIVQTPKTIAVITKADGVHNILDGTFPISEKFRIAKEGQAYRSLRAYWEGTTLVFELADKDSKKDIAKVLFYVRESWTLSPDGKVLTRFRRTMDASKTGERRTLTDQKYVFDKE
ncbi:MAG TPA: hypothetical protein VHW09_24780 [Bryobacteraceae bacterium]|nr:hypothetical protein [Bryobacteraceae bacterium]